MRFDSCGRFGKCGRHSGTLGGAHPSLLHALQPSMLLRNALCGGPVGALVHRVREHELALLEEHHERDDSRELGAAVPPVDIVGTSPDALVKDLQPR